MPNWENLVNIAQFRLEFIAATPKKVLRIPQKDMFDINDISMLRDSAQMRI